MNETPPEQQEEAWGCGDLFSSAFLLLFSCIWMGVFIFGGWPKVFKSYQTRDYPEVAGKVLKLEGDWDFEDFILRDCEVQFTWEGKEYIVTKEGDNFSGEQYMQAMSSGSCPVYVNVEHPEQSVLVRGVSGTSLFVVSMGTLAGLLPCYLTYTLIQEWLRERRERKKSACQASNDSLSS